MGIIIDQKLSFVEHMEYRLLKAEKAARAFLFPVAFSTEGSCMLRLNEIFMQYILTSLDLGGPMWIFQLRKVAHFSYPFESQLASIYKRIRKFYHRCGCAILGVPRCTSRMAVCVRLGWLTYDYHVLHSALVLFLKTVQRRAGVASYELWDDMFSNEHDCRWANAIIFKPAYDTLKRLNKVFTSENSMSKDLFELPICQASLEIKKLLFTELTQKWNGYGNKHGMHQAYPQWKKVKLSPFMYSRYTTRLFNKLICNRGPLRVRKHAIGQCESPLCRHGCKVDEEFEHVMLRCPAYEQHRTVVEMKCKELGVEMELGNLCTDPRLHLRMEIYVGKLRLEKIEA